VLDVLGVLSELSANPPQSPAATYARTRSCIAAYASAIASAAIRAFMPVVEPAKENVF
jgi:hypothetical protein